MIEVTISVMENHRRELTMHGHAGAEKNEEGHDLVCAAASMLCFTLAARMRELYNLGLVHGVDMELTEGNARIAATPKGNVVGLNEAFSTVAAGFKILSEQHPGCVRLTTRYD